MARASPGRADPVVRQVHVAQRRGPPARCRINRFSRPPVTHPDRSPRSAEIALESSFSARITLAYTELNFFFLEPAMDVRVFVLSLQRMPKNGYNNTLAFRLKTHSYNTNDKHA
jgi:hypothetical protein